MREYSIPINSTEEDKEIAEQPLEVEISSGEAKASICPEVGGMVTRFSIGDKDILYFDQEVLTKEALSEKKKPKLGVPFLFPFSGPDIPKKEVRQHGGVRQVPWIWENQTDDSANVAIRKGNIQDNKLLEEYDKKYGPGMDFESRVAVSVDENILEYNIEMTNTGKTDLPIKPGLHPYFNLDASRQGEIKTNLGNFDFVNQPWQGESLKADWPEGEEPWFVLPGIGKVTIQASPEFKNFVIWSQRKGGNPETEKENYICIEPWTNMPDEDSDVVLKPGDKKELFVRFIVEPEDQEKGYDTMSLGELNAMFFHHMGHFLILERMKSPGKKYEKNINEFVKATEAVNKRINDEKVGQLLEKIRSLDFSSKIPSEELDNIQELADNIHSTILEITKKEKEVDALEK